MFREISMSKSLALQKVHRADLVFPLPMVGNDT